MELGKELVRRGIGLVYGGGSVGIMGVLSRAVQEGGGDVVGVIPEALTPIELSGPMVGTTIVVRTMHERKAKMASLADCFIALPGGYGTLEELMEMLTWSNLGFHSKPVGVLNVVNYYDPLLQMFDRMVTTGFLLQAQRDIIICESTPSGLIDQLLLRGGETARDGGQPPLPTRPILPSHGGESLGGGDNDGNNESKGTLTVPRHAEETGTLTVARHAEETGTLTVPRHAEETGCQYREDKAT
ncbi:hypothetical protein CBR_g29553 [Chara braunii]|uniref:Cytokinin riboside 5'-monophosphate phosphoribohydrolase n=1 Tax=Chara braunii TaxID=69332 RepID=A0A388LAU5_CHABU|nr:hypothetical protein CBR_g29553 [Chara braunii]|eukprot:GBG79406.1 hypothetical protein CBR_g29553 [Chara braunii]